MCRPTTTAALRGVAGGGPSPDALLRAPCLAGRVARPEVVSTLIAICWPSQVDSTVTSRGLWHVHSHAVDDARRAIVTGLPGRGAASQEDLLAQAGELLPRIIAHRLRCLSAPHSMAHRPRVRSPCPGR